MITRTALALAVVSLLLVPSTGSAQSKKGINAAMIQVSEGSSILLPINRDADILLTASLPGSVRLRLDKVRGSGGQLITSVNNRFEMDYEVDGVAQPTLTFDFDIVKGKIDHTEALGLTAFQQIHLLRAECFDWKSIRFAEIGVKMR